MYKIVFLFFLVSIFSCNTSPIPSPREIDWEKEWKKTSKDLKILTQDIISRNNKAYKTGNNKFPDNFKYPFDDGFFIDYGKKSDSINPSSFSARYYMDRGILDHFSAFIFTNDSLEIESLNEKIKQNGNDFKIEENWYIVND